MQVTFPTTSTFTQLVSRLPLFLGVNAGFKSPLKPNADFFLREVYSCWVSRSVNAYQDLNPPQRESTATLKCAKFLWLWATSLSLSSHQQLGPSTTLLPILFLFYNFQSLADLSCFLNLGLSVARIPRSVSCVNPAILEVKRFFHILEHWSTDLALTSKTMIRLHPNNGTSKTCLVRCSNTPSR